jgi:hypothetical protein
MIQHCLLVIFFAFSLSIVVVEKGEDWPISLFVRPFRFILSKINKNLSQLLECTVCFSFWGALLAELYLVIVWKAVFMWPFTGFMAVGTTWLIIEFLNTFDRLIAKLDK